MTRAFYQWTAICKSGPCMPGSNHEFLVFRQILTDRVRRFGTRVRTVYWKIFRVRLTRQSVGQSGTLSSGVVQMTYPRFPEARGRSLPGPFAVLTDQSFEKRGHCTEWKNAGRSNSSIIWVWRCEKGKDWSISRGEFRGQICISFVRTRATQTTVSKGDRRENIPHNHDSLEIQSVLNH